MTNFPEKQVVCYKTIDGVELSADVYLPEDAAKPMPLYFYIHGGGWIHGTADEPLNTAPELIARLLDDGVALVSIRYRFVKDGLDYHAPITDCVDALRFFYDRADEFGFDRDRIFVGGASAGGHLSLMVAFAQAAFGTDQTHAEIPIKAIVDLCGPVNFMKHGPVRSQEDSDALMVNFLGGTPEDRLARAEEASPITYIRRCPPEKLMPIIAVHGTLDELVNPEQPHFIEAVYAAAGASFTLISVENGKHSFKAVEGFPPPSISLQEIQEKIYCFLKKTVFCG